MATTRSLNVVISGDASPLKGAFRQAGDHAEKFGKKTEEASHRAAESFKRVHEASKLLLEIGGLSGLAFGIKDVTEEAVKAEAEQKKLKNTVKDAGLSWKAHGKAIDEWLDKTSRASGFVKSDLEAALGNFVRTTGSVTKAQHLEAEAMDIARSKGVGLANAQSILARVYNGSYVGLKRLGIAVTPVTKAQEELKATTKNATDAQKAHAKALDQTATRTLALGLVQSKFGGQSKAYASSTAGAFERAKASLNLLEERIGSIVLPILAKAASGIANLAETAQRKWPQIQATAQQVFARIKPTIDVVSSAVHGLISTVGALIKNFRAGKGPAVAITSVIAGLAAGILTAVTVVKTITAVTKAWTAVQAALDVVLNANPIGIVVVALAGLAVGLTIAYKKSQTFRDIVNGAWNGIKSVAQTVFPIIKKMVQLGLLGPIALAITHFGAIKTIAGDAFGAIKTGAHLVEGAVKSIASAVGAIASAFNSVKKAAGSLNPFNDGIGKGGSLPSGGAFGGSLMGARSSLRPFAAIGSRFGLSVSSGLRPGAITSSGNVSYHSSGEAIDEAGPPAGMMAYFRYLKSHFGGRLAELIYGPGRVGIKNGQPFNFGPALNAQHMDHVHVAYDTGAPGVGDGYGRSSSKGDGLGKFVSTAYGPPWGGIQGTGVTATGVNLANAPHDYGVAVDPSVIKLGTKLKISPNPFGYGGTFTAFDTGGAIKGKRLDFYDWRGRAAQNGWGRRTVSVQAATGSRGSGGRAGVPILNTAGRGQLTVGGHGSSGGTLTHPHNFGHTPTSLIATRDADAAAALAFTQRHDTPLKGRRAPRKGNTPDQQAAYAAAAEAAAGGGDPNQPLIDALAAEAAAQQALTDALNGVQAEMKRQTDFATSVSNTSNYQLTKTLSDLLSGQFIRGVVGRGFTPGTGVEVAY